MLLSLLLALNPVVPFSVSESVWLRVIHINDVYLLDNFPHFKTLVDECSDGPDKTAVVMAGDFLVPSLLSSLDKGRGMVDTMEMCGVTHVCFGNHETDVPSDAMVEWISQSDFVWLNTNMRDLDTKLNVDTEPHDVIEVTHGAHTKRVAFLGLLTDDPSLYRPGSFADAKIEPILPKTEEYLNEEMPAGIDLAIPVTHQSMPEDRAFANKFSGAIFPIVLGGHDHEPYDEIHSGARIIKTGMDAHNTAIVDIKWPVDGDSVSDRPMIDVDLIPTNTFASDPQVLARVQAHEAVLNELERAKLFRIEDWNDNVDGPFSTVDNRLGFSTGSEALVSIVRMGMRAQCGILNAGCIRANRLYESTDWFTWSDLKTEIPYPTGITVVPMPGKVLEATIAHSRSGSRQNPPVASGAYIQTCDQIKWNSETWTIDSIRGEPFDPEALYLTAVPGHFFSGMDNHEPLLEWAKDQVGLATDEDALRPAKMVVVEVFSALIWLEMGSFADIDTDGDAVLTREEVKARVVEVFGEEVADLAVDNIMSVADVLNTGTISPLEMMVVQFVATDMLDHVCTSEELGVMQKVALEVLGRRSSHADVKQVINDLRDILDISGDGKIHREDAMGVLGELKRRNLLR